MAKTEPKAKRDMRFYLEHCGLGTFTEEHIFHPTRKWRLDWADVENRIAVEYDGVTGATGFNRRGDETSHGHVSVSGVMRDAEKINEAQLHGWIVIRVNAASIKSGDAFSWIERAYERRTEAA